MKRHLKFIALILCVIMTAAAFSSLVYATPGNVANQGEVKSESIYVNGVDTGAVLTQITLPKNTGYNPYSSDSVVNVIEVSPTSGLTFSALNCGNYTYNTSTIGTAANKYNSTHDGTVIAAINADPWFLYNYGYNGDKTTTLRTKHQSITRNMLIIDGEIYQTTQIANENALNTSEEYNTGVTRHLVFAQKEDGTFMIGQPWLQTTITNDTTGTFSQEAQGINRLPAPGAIMIYNQRAGSESMAHEDAYEIYLETENSAFSIGETVTGKVVGIYASGETNRPDINENTVIISARDRANVPSTYDKASITDKIAVVKDQFSIGDTVSISVTIRTVGKSDKGDTYDQSQKDDWNNVTTAIGGFYAQVTKGVVNTNEDTKTSAYPVPLIALKEDGTAMMITITSKSDVRAGTRQKYIGEICKELGAYTAIMFDGGGSTSMITYDDGAYVRRTGYADGSVRSVVNALGLVYSGANIDDVTNNETGAYTEIGVTQTPPDETEPPVVDPSEPTPDIVGAATTSYRYYSNIEFINGKGPDGSSEAYQGITAFKKPGATPSSGYATISSGISVDENRKISITGWAVANGGQQGYYWSVDGENWYECTDTQYNLDMSNWNDIWAVGQAGGNLTSDQSTCETRAKFTGATADLTYWAGETVSLYFGVKVSNGLASIMVKIENVAVPALAHEHTLGAEATCTTAQTCTECGEVIVEALGHDEQSHDAKAATCTEGGNEAYVTCSRCDYTTYAATEALGHDEVSHDAKSATCVQVGNDAYVTCSRCDYTTYVAIQATGIHTYDGEADADCNVCGETREITAGGEATPPETSTGDGEADENNTESNVGEENNTESNAGEENNTENNTEDKPTTPSDENKTSDGGCNSTVGFGVIAMIASMALAGSVICRKRR